MVVTTGLWFATFITILSTCSAASPYRHDHRCGGNFLAPNGQVAKCNPSSQYPCCSNHNWCGITHDHCQCGGCIDYRITGAKYRNDRRCGGSFLAPNGRIAECDPNGLYPCCSNYFWCGSSNDHCTCGGCLDYRITGNAHRIDRRCGGDFRAPNGAIATCDPNGRYPCCSNQQWCGSSSDHCTCGGCMDYRISGSEYRNDRRCGSNFYAPNGEIAKCDPNGLYPCCSNYHWCGSSVDHCECGGCIDYRIQGLGYRNDRRCGSNFYAPNGEVAKCDPDGLYPCCSNYHWCGRSVDHCECGGCIDYRIQGLECRNDRRLGSNFYAPNGEVSKCDPNGPLPYCSNYHYSGSSIDHCVCCNCIDYRI